MRLLYIDRMGSLHIWNNVEEGGSFVYNNSLSTYNGEPCDQFEQFNIEDILEELDSEIVDDLNDGYEVFVND